MAYDLSSTKDRWMELPEVKEENINKLHSIAPLEGDVMDYFLKVMEIETGVSGKYRFLEHSFYNRIEEIAQNGGSWLAMTNMMNDLQFFDNYDYVIIPIFKNGWWSLAIIGYGLERERPGEGIVMYHLDFSNRRHNVAEIVQNLKNFIKVQRHIAGKFISTPMRTVKIEMTSSTRMWYSGIFVAGFIGYFLDETKTGAFTFCSVLKGMRNYCSNFFGNFKMNDYKSFIHGICKKAYQNTPKPMVWP